MIQGRNPFTIHNLPFGIVSTRDNPVRRCAVAYNDWAIDLDVLQRSGLFDDVQQLPQNTFSNVSMPVT
jgi:fumarylacetoacetase